ncbi:MAG: LamG domain-containing protein, partial [Bacilli bacterium]|nr:LamG domain-containing protein [Bacilli bacterium]
LTSNTNLQVDKWYHIVVVHDNVKERVYLYINGAIDASDSVLDYLFMDKKESLKIGRGFPDIGAAASTFFMGSIDNLSVYNRAWTADEVKLTYDIDRLVNR